MSPSFNHFIITRFNLIFDVEYDSLNSEAYLSERFRLFDLYCFPSVVSQTNSNFIWLCLFNDQTPEKWRQKIAEYEKRFPNFVPCYFSQKQTENTEKMILSLREIVKNYALSSDFILTTRLDNDDAIHISMTDCLQNYFREHPEEAILSYVNGFQYFPQYNVLKNFTLAKGHFTTFVEKNGHDVKTVLAFPHNDTPANLKFVALKEKKSLWIEVVHRTNVVNTAIFQLRHLLADLFFIGLQHKDLSNFGINQKIPLYNFYSWLLFFEWGTGKFKNSFNRIWKRINQQPFFYFTIAFTTWLSAFTI